MIKPEILSDVEKRVRREVLTQVHTQLRGYLDEFESKDLWDNIDQVCHSIEGELKYLD